MTDFAIGVVSQGAQVCSIIATYIGSLKERDEDLTSISRQAQDLESVFQTLKESLTQGSKDTSTVPATAQVLSSVQRCEVELKSLKQFVARFSGSLSPNARPQDKIIQQAKKLKYPFQKSDISRVQRSLGAIKETLDLALQTLELRHMQLVISKLTTLEETSRQTLNSLHAKQDSLLEQIPQDITTVVAGIDEYDPAKSIYKLASKPSSLATLCNSLEHHRRNTTSSIDALKKAPTFKASSCPCRRRLVHQTRRVSLLSWNFWDNETTHFEHYEGCKYFRSNGDERSRVRGLRLTAFVKTAIIVTFYTRTGAGGHSLGAGLEAYATVDRETSPGFRVLSVLRQCTMMLPMQDIRLPDHQVQWERLILAAIQKFESLFRLRKVGAKDVDSSNRSLLHAAAELAANHTWKSSGVEEAFSLSVARFAKFLIKKQVSVSLRDLHGHQAFRMAVSYPQSSISLAEALYPDNADIDASPAVSYRAKLSSQDLARSFRFFDTFPRAAEVLYGPLSKAVLSNDQYETLRLLQKHPNCLQDREHPFCLTPFHLALGNPECLRILVERSNPHLLVQSDRNLYTVIGHAILLSESLCDRREDQNESSCRCTLPLRILLEGGCPIIPYRDFRAIFDKVIKDASLHCKVHLAKTLLQRRQELKSIALQHLSPLEIDKFSLHRAVVLDIYAMQVDELLRHRGIIEFGPLSTYVEERYFYGESPVPDCRSIYQELSSVEDANIYFDLGFHDITAPLDEPRKRWPSIIYGPYYHTSLPFVKWLLDRHAPLCEWVQHKRINWTGFVADAFILSILGDKNQLNIRVHDFDEELIHELEERMLFDDSVDSCYCRCSPGGCTPFVVRMKVMGLEDNELDIAATTIKAYFEEYGKVLQRPHCYAAIRFLTFQALGISHTCNCLRHKREPKLDASDIAEIHEEYGEILEVLESLIGEFEAHVCEILDAVTDGLDSLATFWSGYWVRRMSQVLSDLSEAAETSKSAAEELGVVWGPEPKRKESVSPKWEGWDYYFKKIEEIE